MKKLCIALCLVSFVLLSRCAKSPDATMATLSQGSTEGAFLNMFQGELPSAEGGNYPQMDYSIDKNGYYEIFGNTYMPVSPPEGEERLIASSFWQINMDDFAPIGVLRDGSVLYTPGSQSPAAFLLRFSGAKDIRCYFREDILLEFPDAIYSEDYTLYDGEKVIPADEQLCYVWAAHVSDSELEIGYGVLDGDWDFYYVNLVNKECPSLCYKFEYVRIDGDYYVENIYMKKDVVLQPELS